MTRYPSKYLLDVNALLALGWIEHEFHHRVLQWTTSVRYGMFASCSITELGFVRVLSQIPAADFTLSQATQLLVHLKKALQGQHIFFADANDISHLPPWVMTAKQTTDGHLLQLAAAHGAVLATLDEAIPGAFLIPR